MDGMIDFLQQGLSTLKVFPELVHVFPPGQRGGETQAKLNNRNHINR